MRNTIGAVPLEWYNEEDHVGYDVDGNKLQRNARRDRLDRLIARGDSSKVCPRVWGAVAARKRARVGMNITGPQYFCFLYGDRQPVTPTLSPSSPPHPPPRPIL